MKSFISSIGTANPRYCFSQLKIGEFMAEAVNMNQEERQRLMSLYRATGISKRYSVLEDFGKGRGEYQFFPNTADMEPFPTVSQRMELYKKEALIVALDAIKDCLGDKHNVAGITHLITVSCTGMYAPGIDLEIVEALGLNTSIKRTCINYMGCYAAFNALKVADSICKSEAEAKVLIVCVELCTIHYQKSKDWDHLLSNAIFGDGAAAVLMESSNTSSSFALSPDLFYCDVLFGGKRDMAWHISDFGFEMTLSSYIPAMIEGGINTLANGVLEKAEIEKANLDFVAIHPGGKKIIEAVEKAMSLEKDKTRYSHHVLREYGNMSSPSILFVLKEIMKDLKLDDGDKKILAFAFGPGLTIESVLLNVEINQKINQIKSFNRLFWKNNKFSIRSDQEEIMDDLHFEGEVLGKTLRELEIINKWLGGNNVTLNALDRVINDSGPEFLKIGDLGCGSAEMLKLIHNKLIRKGIKACITGIDANDYVVRYASKNCEGYRNIHLIKQNVFSEEFRSMKFDIITCTLFLHHFSDPNLKNFLRQLSLQTTKAVIINDIHRHWLAYYSIKFLTIVFSKSYMVKYDARLSVLRAFKKSELQELFSQSGFSKIEIKWKWAFRYQIILWK